MKTTVIAQNREHLIELINREIDSEGVKCDLNHIDVSNILSMSGIFEQSKFNGNISNWNVSKVRNMSGMFLSSKFNGDISKWNVSKVLTMYCMFFKSSFNGDISQWDVCNLEAAGSMFKESRFKRDISDWKPYKLEDSFDIFNVGESFSPYWAKIEDQQKRNMAIDNYWLKEDLDSCLTRSENTAKKIKI